MIKPYLPYEPDQQLLLPAALRPLGKVSDFQSLKYIYSARETLFSPIDR